jgi:ribonuclease HI
MKLFLYTDGGARGNPGPAAIGAVLKNDKKENVKEMGSYIGVGTNNEAEYAALILGLKMAIEKGDTAGEGIELECFLDSELIVRQLNGIYKVKNPKMREFFKQVKLLEPKFSKIEYKHIKRELNTEADAIVNQVLDAQ